MELTKEHKEKIKYHIFLYDECFVLMKKNSIEILSPIKVKTENFEPNNIKEDLT